MDRYRYRYIYTYTHIYIKSLCKSITHKRVFNIRAFSYHSNIVGIQDNKKQRVSEFQAGEPTSET